MTHMSTWLVRLNGMPILEVTAPSYMQPQALARDIMLYDHTDSDQVTWRWLA